MNREFEQVIRQNHGRILFIARRYGKGSDVEDIYQEILMQLWRSFANFSGDSSRETWLYRVALNTAVSFVRGSIKHGKLSKALQGLLTIDTQPSQENCQAEILQTFASSLSDTDANILMMYLDGLSANEMAKVTAISSNAINSRVKRIKQQFEQKFIEDSA